MEETINTTDKLPFKISLRKKKEGKFCCAYNCSNKPGKKKGGLCDKHYARKIRVLDPVQSRYNQFRSNATRRGKPVEISLSQFREFCEQTGYILEKGRRGYAATIDRIRNYEGYTLDNIRIITNRQNASKGSRELDDCPF